jgi:hypothetical protein
MVTALTVVAIVAGIVGAAAIVVFLLSGDD